MRASDDPLARHVQRLDALGAAAFPHVAGALGPHLRRTAQLLQQWGSRSALCVAGLYHAVYGTDGIRGELLSHRRRRALAADIGADAERIVYVYGACDRDAFHPRIGRQQPLRFVDRYAHAEYPIDDGALRDLCELTLANELELVRSSAAFAARHRDDVVRLAEQMRPYVTVCAYAACSAWASE